MSIEKAYDQWSSQYDSNKNRTRDMDHFVTKEILQNLEFNRILELGCGTGKNTAWFQTKTKKILAVDFSEEMLNIAKIKTSNSKVIFQKADITENWKWTSEKYDLVSCNLILEHIENLSFIFDQAFSKLESGGRFFISELHPFKQYAGSKARFDTENGSVELQTFTHHISEFLNAAFKAGFRLEKLDEWFDQEEKKPPRILSMLFQKP